MVVTTASPAAPLESALRRERPAAAHLIPEASHRFDGLNRARSVSSLQALPVELFASELLEPDE